MYAFHMPLMILLKDTYHPKSPRSYDKTASLIKEIRSLPNSVGF